MACLIGFLSGSAAVDRWLCTGAAQPSRWSIQRAASPEQSRLTPLIPESSIIDARTEGVRPALPIAAEQNVELAGVELKDSVLSSKVHVGIMAVIPGSEHLWSNTCQCVL